MNDHKKFVKEYSKLGINDSFYLAYRDIPNLIKKYIKGKKALDFGCGGGRSTRFLKKLGFEVVGVDKSVDMIKEAKKKDNKAGYYKVENGKLPFKSWFFDLILAAIVFLEIPTKKEMIKILKKLKKTLKNNGTIIIVTGTPEAYKNNWASFICDFSENKNLKSGDKARIQLRGTDASMYDYVWFDDDYKDIFNKAKLEILETLKPMPRGDEPYKWYSEINKPLWVIYVLRKK